MSNYFLGIDVSKGYADFVIVDQKREVAEPTFQLDDTFQGHQQLYQVLSRFIEERSGARLYAGIESTGGYENNWLAALGRFQASLPVQVARVNPMQVRSHAEAEGSRTITDGVSARYIATFLLAHPNKVRYQREDALSELRDQWTFIEQLKKQRTALFNQLESLLYRAHPELMRYLSGKTPAWLLKLLTRYPTAERLGRARPRTVAKIPYVSDARAEALVERASTSAASAAGEVTEELVRELARQLLHFDGLIGKHEERLARALDLPQDVELLKSFGAIGDYSAVGLLLEIQTVERFSSAKKMAAFFGVHPVYKQSGDGVGAMRMSKKGSSRMRQLLFMITLTAIQDHPIIQPLYERLVEEEGKAKMVALGACMHKTLRIIYGILKHQTPFDAEIDRRNRARARGQSTGAHEEKKRRYQRYDVSAPVSDRTRKRRRLQRDSQGAVDTMCGISPPTAAYLEQPPVETNGSQKQRCST